MKKTKLDTKLEGRKLLCKSRAKERNHIKFLETAKVIVKDYGLNYSDFCEFARNDLHQIAFVLHHYLDFEIDQIVDTMLSHPELLENIMYLSSCGKRVDLSADSVLVSFVGLKKLEAVYLIRDKDRVSNIGLN